MPHFPLYVASLSEFLFHGQNDQTPHFPRMIPQSIRFDALLYVCNILVAVFPSSRCRHLFYRKVMGVELAADAHILSGLWLDARGNCRIGSLTTINQRCRLDNRGGITIGNSVNLSPGVQVLTADHDLQDPGFVGRERAVRIGDYVFIGSGAIVLPGVELGKGCAVAAGAVVTKDVAPLEIVAGVPARKIGERSASALQYASSGKRHFF